jgi:4-hydroxy-tetrahydrodipicolinate synthase
MKKIDNFKNLKESLNGPVQTIFVPFNSKLNIDYFALKKHIKILCSLSYVKCLYLMPYNGRYSQLSENEVLKLNKFCIKQVKKKRKLIIVSDPIHASTETKLKFCLHAKKNGADLFSSIFREKYFSDEQVFLHYKKIASSNMPILVHLMPFLSGYDGSNMNWKHSTLTKLSTIKNIIAIKEDTKSLKFGKTILKKFKKKFHIIFAGRKKLILSLKKSGLTSYLNGTSVIDPEIDNIFWTLFKINIKKAEKFVEQIDDPFWDNLSYKYGWHRLNKACLEINGIMKRYERLPMIALNKSEYNDVNNKILIIKKRLHNWKKNFTLKLLNNNLEV